MDTRNDDLVLVDLPVNSAPLGSLQLARWSDDNQSTAECVERRGAVGLDEPIETHHAETGIDCAAIQLCLVGRMSPRLCRARILDNIRANSTSSEAKTRELGTIISQSRSPHASLAADDILSLMVGGFWRDAILCSGSVLDVSLLQPPGTASKLHELPPNRLQQCMAASFIPPSRGCSARASEHRDRRLNFRRRCLQAHPQRRGGDLSTYFAAHVEMAFVQQQENIASPSASSRPVRSRARAPQTSISDFESLRLQDVLAGDATVLEHSKERFSKQTRAMTLQKASLRMALRLLQKQSAYELLGVPRDASDAELTRAYREQAREAHPDRRGSTEAFQALQAAFELIKEHRKQGDGDSVATGPSSVTVAQAPPAAQCPLDVAERGGVANMESTRTECVGAVTEAAEERRGLAEAATAAEAATVNFEVLAQQAELALEMAQMCSGLAKMKNSRNSNARRVAARIADVTTQAAHAVGTVGRLAVSMPKEVMELLGNVVEQCTTLGDTAVELVHEARQIMALLQDLSLKGLQVVNSSTQLLPASYAAAVDDVGTDDTVNTVASVAAAAENAAQLSLLYAEVQMRAQQLAASLHKLGVNEVPERTDDDTDDDLQSHHSHPSDDDHDSGGSDSDAAADDEIPSPRRHARQARRCHRLRSLNREVAQLQAELKTLISAHLALVQPVTSVEKQALFHLVVEVLRRAADEARASFASDADAVDRALSLLITAASWNTIASPSFEARLLRFASLVDAALLQSLLHSELLSPCLALIDGHCKRQVAKAQCDAALADMMPATKTVRRKAPGRKSISSLPV